MNTSALKLARFDTRLSSELKDLFERAAYLGGYKNLSDFVISAVHERAKEIIKDKERIIASESDAQIFFDAITNPPKPSENLRNALKDYENFMASLKND